MQLCYIAFTIVAIAKAVFFGLLYSIAKTKQKKKSFGNKVIGEERHFIYFIYDLISPNVVKDVELPVDMDCTI